MNLKGFTYPVLLLGFAFTSCILEEPLNAECDIVSFSLDNRYLVDQPTINNNEIVIIATDSLAISKDIETLAPVLTVTEGAKVVPESGTVRDFSKPEERTYTVYSQDGNWNKTYTIKIVPPEIPTYHSFDKNIRLSHFYEFIQEDKDLGYTFVWETANLGYRMTGMAKDHYAYPTVPEENGYIGSAVKLKTCDTGFFGNMVKMPLAAGNLFIGNFDVSNATSQPLKATCFGRPFKKVPFALKGWYKYKPGATFTDKDKKPVEGRIDECDIYGVLYESTEETPFLTGDNVLTHENIVALARIDEGTPTDEFKKFMLPFEYRKQIDAQKLAQLKYKLALVFTSSKDGAFFEGAVGSELIIDEIELICN
ncbi:MAG: PCMD domain-containing protein [Bacteroidales bacterium]